MDDDQEISFSSTQKNIIKIKDDNRVFFNKVPKDIPELKLNNICSENLYSQQEEHTNGYFKFNSITKKMLSNIKKYGVSISNTLDLHGLIYTDAEHMLKSFLMSSRINNYKIVLIIHGKGLRSINALPVLKNMTLKIASEFIYTKAFMPALPNIGGEGATIIFLK